MKRSEAVKKLGAKVYLELMPLVGDLDTARKFAEIFLTEAESIGLQPPVITVLATSYNRSEGRMGYDANEWEPENGSDSEIQST